MTGNSPRAVTAELERRPPLTDAGAERFAGYGVMGLTFTLGDVLAFRRVPASSIGPAYTSIWHRDPRGRWTVYTDGDPALACPRYFAPDLAGIVRAPIRLEWTGPRSLAVAVPDHQLDWAIRLEARAGTRAWSALARLLPRRAFLAPGPAVLLGALAGRLLRTAPLRLRGRTPGGQWFAIRPSRLWAATASAAVVGGRDLGPLGPHPRAPYLGDLVLPDRGLFMAGEWLYERYDPDHGPTRGAQPPVSRRAPAPGRHPQPS